MSCNCNSPKGYDQPHVGQMGGQKMQYEGAPMMPNQGPDHYMGQGGQQGYPYPTHMMQQQSPMGMHPGMGMGPGPGMGMAPGYAPMHPGMGHPMMGHPHHQHQQQFPNQGPMGQQGYMYPQPSMTPQYGGVPSNDYMGYGGQPTGASPFAAQPQQAPMGPQGMHSSPGMMPQTGYMPVDEDFD